MYQIPAVAMADQQDYSTHCNFKDMVLRGPNGYKAMSDNSQKHLTGKLDASAKPLYANAQVGALAGTTDGLLNYPSDQFYTNMSEIGN